MAVVTIRLAMPDTQCCASSITGLFLMLGPDIRAMGRFWNLVRYDFSVTQSTEYPSYLYKNPTVFLLTPQVMGSFHLTGWILS